MLFDELTSADPEMIKEVLDVIVDLPIWHDDARRNPRNGLRGPGR